MDQRVECKTVLAKRLEHTWCVSVFLPKSSCVIISTLSSRIDSIEHQSRFTMGVFLDNFHEQDSVGISFWVCRWLLLFFSNGRSH